MRKIKDPSRIASWLNDLPIEDRVERQMATLLQVILLGFITILLLAALVNFSLPGAAVPPQTILLQTFISLLVMGIPLFLLRRGSFRASVFVIITLLLIVESFAILSSNLR